MPTNNHIMTSTKGLCYSLTTNFTFIFLCILSGLGQTHDFENVITMGPDWISKYNSISIGPQGEIFAAGSYAGSSVDMDPGIGTDFMTGYGESDAFVHKLDADGNYQWSRVFRSTGKQSIIKVQADKYGNVYSLGEFEMDVDFDEISGGGAHLYVADEQDIFITKHDPNGNLIWVRTYGKGGVTRGIDFALVEDRFLYITGLYEDRLEFPLFPEETMVSNGQQDFFVINLDVNGYLLWAHGFGSEQHDVLVDVEVDRDGDVYVGGYFSGEMDLDPGPDTALFEDTQGVSVFILKLDHDGSYDWAHALTASHRLTIYSMHSDFHDNIYLHGSIVGSADLDPSSSQTVISSQSPTLENNWLLKLNEDGGYLKSRVFDGDNFAYSRVMETDYDFNLYIGGSFRESMDTDPSANSNVVNSNGNLDAYLIKMDSDFNHVWTKTFGSTEDDYLTDFAFKREEYDFYLAGEFKQTVDFDPGPGISEVTSGFYENAYLSKFSNSHAGQEELATRLSVSAFPNPTRGEVTFKFKSPQTEIDIEVFNAVGQLLQTHRRKKASEVKLSLPSKAGVYTFRITTEDGVEILRVIRE